MSKKINVINYASACVILLVIVFFYWFLVLRHRAYTDDAYVEGNQVFITPLRKGFITAIHSDDTFLVNEGELLIELDKTDAQIALEQAKENLAQAVRELCQSYHQVFSYAAEIEVKKAELLRATQDFEKRKEVVEEGGVSTEDYEHAVAALSSAYFSLKWTEALYDKAYAFIQGTTIRNHPKVLSSIEKLREAWVQLYRSQIYSPVKGLTAQRKIQVGMWVKEGEPLLSVIPLDQIWVNANFKETQLKHMRIGQRVKITSDLYGKDVVYHGKIVGLPGGAGNAFSLLPPQNLSGNWIKIVQRLPVRVALDPEQVKSYPLRIGLSMEATVDLLDVSGELVPKTNANSPTYETTIYEEEEKGDLELANTLIENNVDPHLTLYLDNPL